MAKTLGISLFAGLLAGAAVVWRAESLTPDRTTAEILPIRTAPSAADPRPEQARGPDRLPVDNSEPSSSSFRRRVEADDLPLGDLPSVLREWARTDPAGFLGALPTLDLRRMALPSGSDTPPYLDALRLASEADPRYALDLGDRQAGPIGIWIRSTALEALAAEDPDAALQYLAGAEISDTRQRLLAAVATGFARADLDAAVAWMATLGKDDGAAFYPVIDAVAVVDLPRAIELDMRAIELDYGGLDYGSVSWLENGLEADRQDPARIADILASMHSTGLLANALAWWAQSDPYGAIAWIQSQETISSLAVQRMAARLATRDYGTAMALAPQFSPAVRAVWIKAVLATAAAYDVQGALDALEAFRGEPVFQDTFLQILGTANTMLGPAKAAAMAGTSPTPRIAGRIASDWSKIAPRDAASWALSIEDGSLRFATLRTVVVSWAGRDAEAAESWVLGIADGELRSSMLQYVCGRAGTCRPKF